MLAKNIQLSDNLGKADKTCPPAIVQMKQAASQGKPPSQQENSINKKKQNGTHSLDKSMFIIYRLRNVADTYLVTPYTAYI